MKLEDLLLLGVAAATITACAPEKKTYASYELYPVAESLEEMVYTPAATTFSVWAPTAEDVRLMIYEAGEGGSPLAMHPMNPQMDGTWTFRVEKDLMGKFYTFNVRINDQWKGDTPGINAKAVGVNGQRAAIINQAATNPKGWEQDRGPRPAQATDVVIYEMHHRDFSISPTSGIRNKGKFLALTETNTKSTTDSLPTGIDHLQALGITHVHLLPSYDYGSVDETKLSENKYNWGYDPVNYNVPEGSYSTNPYEPATRIKEFKQMVQALHKAGIGVIMDVVYNHTYNAAASAFERTAPGYFYRQKADSTLANASGCGNETASDRPMMRRFMIESVCHWMKEYHIDGFRFDLMGIHDIETMNEIRKAATAINPSVIIYGEGWAAEAPQLPEQKLAMKANMAQMPGIAAFSDELRDALRGPFNDDRKGAFLAGLPGMEQSLKFGIAGAIQHPQVAMDSVNYTKKPWAAQPIQKVTYVSCHDDMCLVDRLNSSIPGLTPEGLKQLDLLAQTAVFTSQGIPFLFAGEEVMRNKKGVHNSFESPDDVNAIDWSGKHLYADVFAYYQGLIRLRKQHPAFRMHDAQQVRKHLQFLPVEGTNLVAFRLTDNANGDLWNTIVVALNARPLPAKITLEEGKYTVVCRDGRIDERGLGILYAGEVTVPARSALILWK